MLKNSLIILSLFLSTLVSAQVISSVQFSKDTVIVGEEFNIQFSFFSDDPNAIESINLNKLDSIENVYLSSIDTSAETSYLDFEITDYGNWAVNQKEFKPALGLWNNNNGKYNINFVLKAIAWDYGVFLLDGLSAKLTDGKALNYGGAKYLMVTPPSNYTHKDTLSPISEIKPIIHEPVRLEDYYTIGFILLGLLLLTLGYFLYQKYKKDQIDEIIEIEEPILPAHVIANDQLNELKAKMLWQKGEIKSYQSELTFIIRSYLENRYNVHALESTTEEITKSLKNVDFDPSLKQDLTEILTMADLVKFAKAKPGENIHASFMLKAEELVERTKKIEVLDDE